MPGLAKFALADVCFVFVDERLVGSGPLGDLPEVVETALVLPFANWYGRSKWFSTIV